MRPYYQETHLSRIWVSCLYLEALPSGLGTSSGYTWGVGSYVLDMFFRLLSYLPSSGSYLPSFTHQRWRRSFGEQWRCQLARHVGPDGGSWRLWGSRLSLGRNARGRQLSCCARQFSGHTLSSQLCPEMSGQPQRSGTPYRQQALFSSFLSWIPRGDPSCRCL